MRPPGSVVRRRIATILDALKSAHGYEIYKHYVKFFPKTSLRNIYYNLRKGASLGEFIVVRIESKPGIYSWGGEAQRIYYALGPLGEPLQIKEIYEELKPRDLELDWKAEAIKTLKLMVGWLDKAKNYDEKRKVLKRIENALEKMKEWCKEKGINLEEVIRETPLHFMWKENF